MTRISTPARRVAFFWVNFGPMHADRVDAVARLDDLSCVGVELYAKDPTYDWKAEKRESFEKFTLFPAEAAPSTLRRLWALLRIIRRVKAKDWFLCHYEKLDVLLFAFALRVSGHRVFTMGCSKFDDKPRGAFGEALKSFFLLPYLGAISSPRRSADYFRFLGLRRRPVVEQYNTLSLDRIRNAAGTEPAPAGAAFGDRDFVIVARFVEKKNLPMALDAFKRFTERYPSECRLHMCGAGPMEATLRAMVAELELGDRVVFHGFLQSDDVARLLAQGLALILPSTEEQFGNVVIEAQAMGLPVLISEPSGARDILVRNWQNGFVFEPDNPEGLAEYMRLVASDEALWRRLCAGASAVAPRGDVATFAAGVAQLLSAQRARNGT
ncbi:MAG: glycosyltransferase [Marivita sp.]